jgi:fatty-acyl-CoA synthase
MMDVPLNAWLLFDHAPRHFADVEVVTRMVDGAVHRYTYADFGRRSQQLMHALDRLGLDAGDRVGTLAWNHYRHLECYFGIPCSGRVLHTLNLRLSAEELSYIIGHADDRAILVDPDLLGLLEEVHAGGGLDGVEHVVVLADEAPDSSIPGVLAYEQLLAEESETYPRPQIDEGTTYGLCYTSGTTGRSKGVEYTHRSAFIHALAASTPAGMSVGPGDAVLPVVPMFHANAWGLPHAATMMGAKQVFLAGSLAAGDLADLLAEERVTIAAGVPTVWFELGEELARRGSGLPDLRHIVCGGSQPPRALIERFLREFDIPIVQAWGMTETSPLASMAWPKHSLADLAEAELTDRVRTQAGLPLPGVDVTIRSVDGEDAPWDGSAMGDLLVRGPFITDGYVGGEGADRFTDDGWFHTGDVAVGSPDGYFVIADRTKDLIKSGGEWISSVDMEAAIMALDAVAEAAVIGVPDPKWQERPVACVVLHDGADLDLDEVHRHLQDQGFARWQLPDRIERIAEVPRTTVGKFDKKSLRARFAEGD